VRRETRILLEKATDSILLAVEHYNRPYHKGRPELVLIMIDRAFELLLKSVILQKGGKIREKRAKETIGFDTAVRKCISDTKLKTLTEEESLTIQIINSLRDAAQHYFIDIQEEQLYLHLRSGLTLFDKILKAVFKHRLSKWFPECPVPISSVRPIDFNTIMDIEFKEIRKFIKPGSRKAIKARARLRPLAIMEASLGGSRLQPSEFEITKIINEIKKRKPWTKIFPALARINFSAEGEAYSLSLRISKSEGDPITIVPEGTPGSTVIAIRRVEELGFYSLCLTELASKVGLSVPKSLAVIKELKIQGSPDYFKEFVIGTAHFKRYSPRALDFLKSEVPKLDLTEIWNKHKPTGRKKKA